MLVLTRKKLEKIVIGEVVITIVGIGTSNVRVGIEAPADMLISRPKAVETEQPEAAAA